MTWETALLAILATETAIVGWLIRNTYLRICSELSSQNTDIKRLDRARERHRITLAEICMTVPQMRHFKEFNRDD